MIKKLFFILSICLVLNIAHSKPNKSFEEPAYKNSIEKVINQIYLEDYTEGLNLLNANIPKSSLYHTYFEGMIYMAIFNDLGDTSALNLAYATWSKLQKNIEDFKDKKQSPLDLQLPLDLYYGLTLVQLSYIYQVKNQTLKSTLAGKKGIKILGKQNQYFESVAVEAIYEYYKQQLLEYLDWIPFVSGNSKAARLKLAKYYKKSPYLGNILLTSLIWMYFDEGLYPEGLILTENFLKKYPKNRLYRSIRADLLFKLKRYKESRNLFEELKKEYENYYKNHPEYKGIPIAYLSIIGNLVRVNHARRDEIGKNKYGKIWFSSETQEVEDWLPESLVKSLKKFEHELKAK